MPHLRVVLCIPRLHRDSLQVKLDVETTGRDDVPVRGRAHVSGERHAVPRGAAAHCKMGSGIGLLVVSAAVEAAPVSAVDVAPADMTRPMQVKGPRGSRPHGRTTVWRTGQRKGQVGALSQKRVRGTRGQRDALNQSVP